MRIILVFFDLGVRDCKLFNLQFSLSRLLRYLGCPMRIPIWFVLRMYSGSGVLDLVRVFFWMGSGEKFNSFELRSLGSNDNGGKGLITFAAFSLIAIFVKSFS